MKRKNIHRVVAPRLSTGRTQAGRIGRIPSDGNCPLFTFESRDRRGILRSDVSTEFDAIMQNHTVFRMKSKWQLLPPTNKTLAHSNIALIGQSETPITNSGAHCYLPAAVIHFEENVSCRHQNKRYIILYNNKAVHIIHTFWRVECMVA